MIYVVFFVIGFINGWTATRAYRAIKTAEFINRAIGN